MKTLGIIPLAGEGSRLGLKKPKSLAIIKNKVTVIEVIIRKIMNHCDHIVLIINPKFEKKFFNIISKKFNINKFTFCYQATPKGMGDAIFMSQPIWRKYLRLVVIWGDQLGISKKTINKSIKIHKSKKNLITLPITKKIKPYVEIKIKKNKINKIIQSREGEITSSIGYSDLGFFVLSNNNLLFFWDKFLKRKIIGRVTKETNFLPFLKFINDYLYKVNFLEIICESESRGLNNISDLRYFRKNYDKIK